MSDDFRTEARKHLSGETFRKIDSEARDTRSWHESCDREDTRRHEERIKERDSGRDQDH